MTKNHRMYRNICSMGALVCAMLLPGCREDRVVQGTVDAVDMRDGMLFSSSLKSINGSYGDDCTNRSGNWSLKVDPMATLDNAELSVVLGDDACVLTLTSLHTTDGVLAASPSMALTTSYKMTPSEFDDPVLFYGNAKLSSVSFDADFTLTLLYSDDPSKVTGDNTAEFEVVESGVAGDAVGVPDYTIDTSSLHLLTDFDQVVVSASGSIGITAGMVTGETYVVADASGLSTYDDIDTAYLAGTPAALGASVAAAAFDLVGEDLDAAAVKRTLIIARTENGVTSYQAFEITFHEATVNP